MPSPKDPEKYRLWKENLSKAHKGNKKCHPPGWGEKVSTALAGRERSEAHCQNISKAKIGKKQKPRSEAHCRALSDALRNKPKSEIHKKHLSESRKHLSKDALDNIAIAAKRRFENPEYVKNHTAANIRRVETLLGGFWYGNIRYYENQYCEKWTEDLRRRVRAFFNYTCFECGVVITGRALNVHHVHYNKKTCCDGSPHDLVPLCPTCHTRTNFNRDYWEDHFVEKLYDLHPDGKCFFTREEMRDLTRSPTGVGFT